MRGRGSWLQCWCAYYMCISWPWTIPQSLWELWITTARPLFCGVLFCWSAVGPAVCPESVAFNLRKTRVKYLKMYIVDVGMYIEMEECCVIYVQITWPKHRIPRCSVWSTKLQVHGNKYAMLLLREMTTDCEMEINRKKSNPSFWRKKKRCFWITEFHQGGNTGRVAWGWQGAGNQSCRLIADAVHCGSFRKNGFRTLPENS